MRPIPFLAGWLACGLAALSWGAAERPNVIFILTDDHGWPDLGAAGFHDDLKTPHLDRLAASGIRVTQGYSSAPQCVPSRAGLLTGKYQNRFGVESNGVDLAGFDAERTVAERLREAGYATAQIGKWHLGPGDRIDRHGFDSFYDKNRDAPCHANFDPAGNKVPVHLRPHTVYHLDDCSNAALTFIRREKDRPFFLYLAYRAPHVPLDAPRHHLDRFPGRMPERRRQALAMLAAVDDGVGAIVAELGKLDLTRRTLLFVIGDNGAPLKIHKLDAPGGGPGWDGSLNEPMNGEKGMLSEGGIRVPFLVCWPGTLPAGRRYDHPVIALDAAATALDLAGIRDPSLDGINLVPHLQQDSAPDRVLTWRWIAQSAIRKGKWKLLVGGQREYLFDLDKDPGETTNLHDSHPDLARDLRRQLSTWAGELKPAGLASGRMAEVWESYFDHYLDGQPAPPLAPAPADAAGWIARGAALTRRDGLLHVTPTKGSGPPFLVKTHLTLHGPFTATVRIRSTEPGPLGIAWRLEGQKDFTATQRVTTRIDGRPDFQEVRLEAPAAGTTLHLRLHLPGHETALERITLKDTRSTRSWQPGE